jgi:hypothetical protein
MPLRYPLSTTGTIHLISGTTQLLTLPVAALLINLSLARRNKAWARARTALLWTAVLPVVALIGFLTHLAVFVLPLGPNAYGPGVQIGWPPRILFLTYAVWVMGVASKAIAVRRHEQ